MKKLLIVALVAVFAGDAVAQVKISALPNASTLAGTELIAGVQSGVTVSMTPSLIAGYYNGLSPTLTGIPTYSAVEPRIKLNQTSAGTDLKLWDIDLAAGVLCMRTRTDADAVGATVMCVTRGTTTTVSNMQFGSGTSTYSFSGSGTASFGGQVSTSRLLVTSVTAPTLGLYAPATGTTGINGAPTITGTKFTAAGTGCTIATTVGGPSNGTFTLATGPCTSVAITMGGATTATAANGWTCQAHDRTSPTTQIGGESSSTTTTATITIPAGAGATDVISFSCMGF